MRVKCVDSAWQLIVMYVGIPKLGKTLAYLVLLICVNDRSSVVWIAWFARTVDRKKMGTASKKQIQVANGV